MRFDGFAAGLNLRIIAPPGTEAPAGTLIHDSSRRRRLINITQLARGTCYRNEGALPESALQPDGRHDEPYDNDSWIVVSTTPGEERVIASIRLTPIADPLNPGTLRLQKFLQRIDPSISPMAEAAICRHLERAAADGAKCVLEAGGWFSEPDAVSAPFGVILCAWGFGEVAGGARYVALATSRNNSGAMLIKMGAYYLEHDGKPLRDIYDPYYNCPMSLLGFDSWRIHDRHRQFRDLVVSEFAQIQVVAD